MSNKLPTPAKKPGHFSNWLSFLSGNEDAMMALVLAKMKPETSSDDQPFSKTKMNVSGHVVQIITLPGQVSQA